MSTDSPAPPPRVLAAEVEALRADLTDARFTSSRSEELLGPVASQALRRENPAPARRILTRLEDPAATLLDLFTLGARIPRAQVEAALPALGVEGAQRLGLLEADGEGPDSPVRALWELAPYSAQDDLGEIEWWIASHLPRRAASPSPLPPGPPFPALPGRAVLQHRPIGPIAAPTPPSHPRASLAPGLASHIRSPSRQSLNRAAIWRLAPRRPKRPPQLGLFKALQVRAKEVGNLDRARAPGDGVFCV